MESQQQQEISLSLQQLLQQALIEQDSDYSKIYYKKSKIQASGNGLFAKQYISEGQLITQFYGSIIPTSISNNHPFQNQDKMVFVNQKYCVVSRAPATLANDIIKWNPDSYLIHRENGQLIKNKFKLENLEKSKAFPEHLEIIRNAKIAVVPKDRCFVIATEEIKPNEEIFVDYGFQYWKFFLDRYIDLKIQQNKKLLQKQN